MADIQINVKVVEGQAVAAMKGLEQATKTADKSVESLNLSFKSLGVAGVAIGNVIGNIATKALSQMGEAISHLVGGGLDLEAQIQNLTAQFQALLPPTKDAKKFLEDINKLSDESPFEFPELAETTRTLLTFGVNSDKITETLKVLGDVATASGADLQGLALAFGKATESGIITGRELNEFRNNGIPIIQELAKELGVSTTAVKKLANDGKIDIKIFEAALVSMGQEGGFAFDAMSKRANTLDGAQKRLSDSVETLQKLFGQNLAPTVIAVKNALSLLIEQVSKYLLESNILENVAMGTIVAFNLMVDVFVTVYNSIQGVRYIVTLLGASMISGIVMPIKVTLFALENLIKGLAFAAGAIGLKRAALDTAANSINVFRTTIAAIPGDLKKSADAIANDMQKTADKANHFKTSLENSYITLSTTLKTAAKGTKDAADDLNKGLTESEKEQQSKRLENAIKHSEAMLAEKNKALLAEQQLIFLQDGIISEAEELALLEQQDRFARQLEMEKEQNLQKQIQQDIANQVEKDKLIEHQNQLALLKEANQANQLSRDLQYRQKEAALNKKFLDDAERLEAEKAKIKVQNQKDTFSTIATLSSSNNKTLALIGKAAGITQIAIDTPVAVSKALAAFPPPFNFAAAGLVGAAMAAQAAKIAGINFADGGIVPGTSFRGDNVSANVNSGEMILNRQQQTQLFNIANGSNSGGAPQVIEINNIITLDGEVVARSVSRQVANGLVLGEVV
jgi:tape measure domain-containing protein